MKTSVQRSVKRKRGGHTARYIPVWFCSGALGSMVPPYFHPSDFGCIPPTIFGRKNLEGRLISSIIFSFVQKS
jgi:hypothetical protein